MISNESKFSNMSSRIWILVAFMLPLLFLGLSTSTDTITANQPVKDGDVLVSSGGDFALGFFTPGNSKYRYVGIWYNKVSEQTVVWVANRDNPIPINGTSGSLSINKNGNLVIYETKQSSSLLLWETNVSKRAVAVNYEAQLKDTGNLVLFGSIGDQKDVLWQSFDHPTNTFLPTMKLGQDRRTGLDRFLTSWKSLDDPGTGEYSYRVNRTGSAQSLTYKGQVPVFRSIPWISQEWAGNPTTPYIKTSYVDNQDEVSTWYTLVNSSVYSFAYLDQFGAFQISSWVGNKWVPLFTIPQDVCDRYAGCGAFGQCNPANGRGSECTCLPAYKPKFPQSWFFSDASGGCVSKRGTLGVCGDGDGFINVPDTKLPDMSTARVMMEMSKEACEEECLQNCSCTAYYSRYSGQCFTWYGDLMDITKSDTGGLDLYIRVDAAELAEYSKKSKRNSKKKIVILVGLVVAVPVLIFSILVIWMAKKGKRDSGFNSLTNDDGSLELPIIDMVAIAEATNKFSDANIIGEGGFGSVYKGKLTTGTDIAVKRLSMVSNQGLTQFKNEFNFIAKLQHRNLVRLLGCCIHGDERMLVYEYMPNGSLDSFIFGPGNNGSKLLTWRMRLDIVLGIARGVVYLHQDSRLRIIHRDLKASNVLLDNNMNPKISDFGLARAFRGDQLLDKTRTVVGTYGYMSPEYAIDGIFSVKSDVFSFGVIVLEMVSGRRNQMFHHPEHDLNLLGYAWKLWTEGQASELLDPQVEDSCPVSELLRCMVIGLLCVQKCPKDRPTMSTVLSMLVTEAMVLPEPKQPGYFMERISSTTTSSINDVTMTHMHAR